MQTPVITLFTATLNRKPATQEASAGHEGCGEGVGAARRGLPLRFSRGFRLPLFQ